MNIHASEATLFSRIGGHASRSLIEEIETFPKPGLVSHIDNGSHMDMSADLMRGSALCLAPYFTELASAGARRAQLPFLREIGIRAESRMMDMTGGVNTHRGAIFGIGLLCAAAGYRATASDRLSLGEVVKVRWGQAIANMPANSGSHGDSAARQHGALGARGEAAAGFPAIYSVGLPALRRGRAASRGNEHSARVEACMALIEALVDTNLLHRGGQDGLCYARRSAREFLDAGGIAAPDWLAAAEKIHFEFVKRNLSPGGSADLLAMTLFVDRIEGACSA